MSIWLAGKWLCGAAVASVTALWGLNKIVIPNILFRPPPQFHLDTAILPFSQMKSSTNVWYEYKPNEQQNNKSSHCVVYLHGNACNASSGIPFMAYLSAFLSQDTSQHRRSDAPSQDSRRGPNASPQDSRRGPNTSYDFFIPEYPGYGDMKSHSDLSVSSTYLVLETFLRRLFWQYTNITIIGQSLGTHFATRLAYSGYCNQLILISPFSSLSSLASHHVGKLLGAFVSVADNYDTSFYVHRLPAKVDMMILHGAADSLIPVSESEYLLDYRQMSKWNNRVTSRDQLITLPDVHHNDIPVVEVAQKISQFI
jgi:hypothetical protein